ncbi:hypothetical protein [Agarilytica rhodophyticola]|uniref:hypothetical protein n=1 Tax=Agarilytica rhodophyticola TaxID=1737490 RepID=UPI000CD8E57C|nr:hypothetical protein [Agarilytica rhodophyticola]
MKVKRQANERHQKLQKSRLPAVLVCILSGLIAFSASASDFELAKDRVETALEAGSPLVVHATVVLCTNRTKNTDICNENKPRTNLYWGAQFGVKTYFNRQKHWQRLSVPKTSGSGYLERVAFKRAVKVRSGEVDVYLVADVWRGGDVRKATESFLTMSSGENVEKFKFEDRTIYAGGESHVTAYLGHNGLANFTLDLDLEKNTLPNSAIVLGRRTSATFTEPLRSTGTFPLLTTKGVVTPEAYILEAAILSWFSKVSPVDTLNDTAEVYSKYQKASIAWSRKQFVPGSIAEGG